MNYVRTLAEVAKADGDLVVTLPTKLNSAAELFQELSEKLGLPGYFGRNWNALSDCLRDFSWRPEGTIRLCHQELPQLEDGELAQYLEVLEDAERDWKREGERFVPYFLERDRARIDALLAR